MALDNLSFELEDKYDPAEYLKEVVIPTIEAATKDFVTAELVEYKGEIVSYSSGLGDTMSAISSLSGGEKISADAKKILGTDNTVKKYELCLGSKQLKDYRYGVMLIGYGLTGYPVIVAIDEEIAIEIGERIRLCRCDSMAEYVALCDAILKSDVLAKIIQGIIQASMRQEKRSEKKDSDNGD